MSDRMSPIGPMGELPRLLIEVSSMVRSGPRWRTPVFASWSRKRTLIKPSPGTFRHRGLLGADALTARNRRARFGRDAGLGGRSYVGNDMIHVLEIDPRIARRCLRAGRLQAGA